MSDVVSPENDSNDTSAFQVSFWTAKKVNFSSAQNGVSILKQISLRNHGDTPLESLEISVESKPQVIKEKSWTLDRLSEVVAEIRTSV